MRRRRGIEQRQHRVRQVAGHHRRRGRAGYGEATVDEIAREAGVAKPTVYNRFGDKRSLFVDAEEAALVFRQLDVASARFLGRSVRYYGFIVNDPAVRDSLLGQRPLVHHLPEAPASRCFRTCSGACRKSWAFTISRWRASFIRGGS